MLIRTIVNNIIKENPLWKDVDINTVCFYGDGGIFDSLDLVSFIIDLEEGLGISLSTDKAFSHRNSPFSSMDNLEKFIQEIVDESSNNRDK